MAPAQLQLLLTLMAAILIPASFGGAGFLALREAGLRARRRSRLSADGAVAALLGPEHLVSMRIKAREQAAGPGKASPTLQRAVG